MSDKREREGTPARPAPVVVSSLTGKPIEWQPQAQKGSASGRDQEILRDVPPHWGKGA
ncbi:hypothetical protein KRX56_02315 [Dermabacteraceae bacterium TAE3-ERU27]|nr:hypothetical protein [Dermabacteraceae bacterium TAE3-ERU27]